MITYAIVGLKRAKSEHAGQVCPIFVWPRNFTVAVRKGPKDTTRTHRARASIFPRPRRALFQTCNRGLGRAKRGGMRAARRAHKARERLQHLQTPEEKDRSPLLQRLRRRRRRDAPAVTHGRREPLARLLDQACAGADTRPPLFFPRLPYRHVLGQNAVGQSVSEVNFIFHRLRRRRFDAPQTPQDTHAHDEQRERVFSAIQHNVLITWPGASYIRAQRSLYTV